MEATMHEAKTNLSKLVARARAGEEVILTSGRDRVPMVRMVPIGTVEKPTMKKRPIGLFKGQFEIPDSFFDPLPEEELALWEAPIVSAWADNDGTPKDGK
jgi:antitoxin (DNA-binding transcriptional repressor) of toxin-antitoxin stability system